MNSGRRSRATLPVRHARRWPAGYPRLLPFLARRTLITHGLVGLDRHRRVAPAADHPGVLRDEDVAAVEVLDLALRLAFRARVLQELEQRFPCGSDV